MMDEHVKTISIVLLDGTASGTRTAQLSLSTIMAIVVPRASLTSAARLTETRGTGAYVLVGPDALVPTQKRVYIGESDSVLGRVLVHDGDPKMDFWDEVVMLVAKSDTFTNSHARYVEARLLALAKEAKRAAVSNVKAETEKGKLPAADAAVMEQYINQARLLLGTLGHDIFEPLKPSAPTSKLSQSKRESPLQERQTTFKLIGPNFDATMVVDEVVGQFIVKAGSTAKRTEVPALPATYKNLRKQLVGNGVLQPVDDSSCKFSQDWSFSAPSPAAQVVSGTTLNGRTAWKLESDGRTLAEWQEAKLAATGSG